MTDTGERERRLPLSRDRVLRAAVEVADRGGLGALTMRRLGQELGVEAMSLYKHVANKDEILDGLAEIVVGEIELPAPGEDWRPAMRRRATSARAVFARHSWAASVLESRRNPGPATLRYYDAVIGNLRGAGFPVALAAHAFALLDGFLRGFTGQEQTLSFDTPAELTEVTGSILASFPAEEYPHLAEMAVEHILKPGYDFADEFEFGLDLILDGLERLLAESRG
jgi:AcrR family transcriptional regulator